MEYLVNVKTLQFLFDTVSNSKRGKQVECIRMLHFVQYMWQSWVEMEHYSAFCSVHIDLDHIDPSDSVSNYHTVQFV